MTRKGRERDLAHGAPDGRFGEAVMQCEGYTPDCIYYGRCMLDGECFKAPGHLEAARKIEKLIEAEGGRAGQDLAYLRCVAEMLRGGYIHL